MKKKDARLDLRLPSDLVAAAKKRAALQDRPLSQVVRDLLRAWLAGASKSRVA